MQPAPPIPTVPRPAWSVGDFLLVMVSGFLAVLAASFLLAGVRDTATVFLAALFAQYAGHIAALVYVVRRRGARFSDLGLDVRPIDGVAVFLGAGLQILAAIVISPLAERLGSDGAAQTVTEQIGALDTAMLRAGGVIGVALLAPAVEELMFRGVLYKAIERRTGSTAAIVGSALLFSAFHLFGIDPDNFVVSIVLLLPAFFLLGLLLGRQVHRQGRLGVPIFTHAGFNLIGLLGLFLSADLLGG